MKGSGRGQQRVMDGARQIGRAVLAVLVAAAGWLWAAPAAAANCNIATAQGSTGPADYATYCWLDLSEYVDATARSAAGQPFSYNLPDGTTMTFILKVSGPALRAATAPSWTGAAIGNTAFLNIAGRPILYQQAAGTAVATISNIVLTPPAGGTVVSYMFVAADAESTNNGESLQFTTNGGAWTILDRAGPTTGNAYPTYTGEGTTTFTNNGVAGTVGAYIIGSDAARQVTTTMVGGGLQGAMFAVRFASISLTTVISGARANPADQFTYAITQTTNGAVLASDTTTGTGLGPFPLATLPTSASLPLTLRQSMAAGSASPINRYQSSLTCTNATAGSSTTLPTNRITTSYSFGTLRFGDKVSCTFTETPFPHLTLTKALGAGGRQFANDQFRMDILEGANVVASTDTTGTGATLANATTGLYPATDGKTYGLTERAIGTTVLAQYVRTLACTNANGTSATRLPTSPGDTVSPRLGDVIACTLTNTKRAANALLSVGKSSSTITDPYRGTVNALSIPGAIVRYTVTIANSGPLPVDANTVVMIDSIPAQIAVGSAAKPAFVEGSPPSGLTFNPATDVRYSNSATRPATFAACTYTPVAAYDPAVRHVCVNPKGTMAGSTGTPPRFSVTFDAQIK